MPKRPGNTPGTPPKKSEKSRKSDPEVTPTSCFMSPVATEDMSSVATEDMSSVATEDMSSVATGDMKQEVGVTSGSLFRLFSDFFGGVPGVFPGRLGIVRRCPRDIRGVFQNTF